MKFRGLFFIIFTLIICIYLYILAKNNPFFILNNPLLGFAQIFALWGMVLFCFTFFLSSRFPFLEIIFGSLDKIYKLHQITARLTLIFLIMHFIFLVLNYVGNSKMISRIVLPGNSFEYNLGILGLWTLLAIISITIYVKTEYQWFVRIQKLFIIPLIFGITHMLLIPSDSSNYFPLTIFLLICSFVAVGSWIYKVFLYSKLGPKFNYIVDSFQMLSDDILEIVLSPMNKKLAFLPGQFAYIEFDNVGIPNELHPFSICSSPTENKLYFAIKTYGDFTNQMKLLRVGDLAVIFGPYGSFGKQFLNTKDAVCIAGGVGITPFLGMINYLKTDPNLYSKKVDLFYCSRNEKESVFIKNLEEMVKILPNFQLRCMLSDMNQRLTAQIIRVTIGGIENKLFFLCGPSAMMIDLIKQLKLIGVSSKNIIFEDFNFR